MIVYKCPSCTADVTPDITSMTCTCEHCGTVFSISDNKDLKKITVKIKQIKMALEDCEYEKATKLCNSALNIDPENAEIYYLKLLSVLFISDESRLSKYKLSDYNRSTWGIELYDEYKRAYQFGDENMKKKLKDLNLSIIYNGGADWQEKGEYIKAYHMFKKISGYKDSYERARECQSLNAKAEKRKKEMIIEEQRKSRNEKIIGFIIGIVLGLILFLLIPYLIFLGTC